MKNFLSKFVYAFEGIIFFFRSELNAIIHTIITIIVLILAWYYKITVPELMVIIIAIALVFIAEIANTAIEKLADAVHPETAPGIKNTKDVAAGMVLFSVIIAIILGGLVFYPYICGS